MTPAPSGYRTVEIPESRKAEFFAVDGLAFASEPDAATLELLPVTVPWDRTMAVETDRGVLAAVHASYEFALPVPGATVPCAGLTWVGVRPDHRRRRLLTSMIDTHFARSLARGEAVSALFAAEHGIYGRFGYGSAASNLRLELARGAELRDVPGSDALDVRFEAVDAAVHGPVIEQVHAEAGRGRPGWITRSSDALRTSRLADPPAWRDGGEPLRVVTVLDGDDVRAYALLRRKASWATNNTPASTVMVREAAAIDAPAAHRLWTFLVDLDLTTTVHSPMLAVDDPLLELLVDRRGANPRLFDNIWVRVLDVPAALAGRRYSAPLDLVLEITDARLAANAGRWRLTTGAPGPDGTWDATCTATQDPADLTLDVRELGAAYLGGRSLTALAGAALVTEHRPASLSVASAAFAWPLAPVCSWDF